MVGIVASATGRSVRCRDLALFRKLFQGCDLSVEPSGKVHASQRVDLLQGLFGLAVAGVQRGQVDAVGGFVGRSVDGAFEVRDGKLVVVQDVALEVRVRAVEPRDGVRARQRRFVGALQFREVVP
jgi:hypothetical protein